jgi:hypothetical protein
MDNENFNKELEIKKSKRMTKVWLWASGIFFIFSVFLILAVYKIATNTQNGLTSPLKLLSVQLSKRGEAEVQPADNLVRRYIDGVLVESGKENIFPVAVIIDNHPDSRPPAGLSQASLVYEAQVEGVTTRYLAVFAGWQQLDNIGPVRSARPYFIGWARELSALFVHCGGSPEALAKIIKNNILDLNEFYQGQYFWRGSDRSAPHNIMTSTKKLRSFLMDEDLIEGKYFGWNFKDDEPAIESTSQEITIPEFAVRWIYNRNKNDYTRYLGEKKHLDSEEEEIRAKNVIMAFMPAEVLDEELRLKIETIGIGQAVVCLDGVCREGEWHKKSATSRTRFYNLSGNEFIFNAGPTWIEVVRPGCEVSY